MIGALIAGIGSFLQAAWTASGVVGFAVRTAVLTGASYLLNRALAPSIHTPDTRVHGYSFGAQTSEDQGGAVPVTIGTRRVHAQIVAHYTSVTTLSIGWHSMGGATAVRRTLSTRTVLCCFGEGPWPSAPADSTLRINGRPLSDFSSMTATWKLGTVDQTCLTGWTTFKQDYACGAACLYDEPVTMTVQRTGWSDAEVHLLWDQGAIYFHGDGDADSRTISIKIEVGDEVTDAWHTLMDTTVTIRALTPIRLKFLASGTYTGGSAYTITSGMRPRFRVTRQTADTSSSQARDSFTLACVQVHRSTGFTHPGMVLCSLSSVPDELTAGGITEISCETAGKVVSDGAGGWAVSQSHADAIREILTQPVVEGDGDATAYSAAYFRGVHPLRIREAGFTAQKALAGTQVPDGLGNDADLLQCDVHFSSNTTVSQAVAAVAASGRCGLQCHGRDFGLWVEAPRQPCGILCDGTWLADTPHDPVPIPAADLADEATVSYEDADAAYAEQSICVFNRDLDTAVPVELSLAAATRMHEVARLTRRELARNYYTDLSGSCRTDAYGLVYEGGDVVWVQIDGRSLGGQIVSVSGTTATLDRSVTDLVTGGDALIVQVRDADTGVQRTETYEVSSVSADGKQVTISGSWSTTPAADDPFLFGPVAMLAEDQFEIIEATPDEHLFVTLQYARYVPRLDELDSLAPDEYVPLAASGAVNPYAGCLPAAHPETALAGLGGAGYQPFKTGLYAFTDAGGGKVAWASEEDEDSAAIGYVAYDGTYYQPADNATGTTDTYIYWDPASPNVFSTTSTKTTLAGKYLVCINSAGTPYPCQIYITAALAMYDTADTAQIEDAATTDITSVEDTSGMTIQTSPVGSDDWGMWTGLVSTGHHTVGYGPGSNSYLLLAEALVDMGSVTADQRLAVFRNLLLGTGQARSLVAGVTLSGTSNVVVSVNPGHGFEAGEYAYFPATPNNPTLDPMVGFDEAVGNVFKIASVAATSITLDDTDSSNFTAWTSDGEVVQVYLVQEYTSLDVLADNQTFAMNFNDTIGSTTWVEYIFAMRNTDATNAATQVSATITLAEVLR